MNSLLGKQVLRIARGGDFAHPGEAEAIQLLLSDLGPNSQRQLLDVGCGLGGTAEVVSSLGLGVVTGLDIDGPTIEYASQKYPQHRFLTLDAANISAALSEQFDVVYMFNSLYTMSDQQQVLMQAAEVCRAGGALRIFDYFVHANDDRAKKFAATYEGSYWQPIAIESVPQLLAGTGWFIQEIKDISRDYVRWYEELVARIMAHKVQITDMVGIRGYEQVLNKYRGYLGAVQDGTIGGLILRATRGSV